MGDYRRIKDMLCDEMDRIASKGNMNGGDLEVLYKAADVLKDLETVEAMQGGSFDDGMMDGSYGYSYARGRDRMGRYTRGYSRDSHKVVQEMHKLMEDAEDERTRRAIKDAIREIEK
jgi:hypothetical protein